MKIICKRTEEPGRFFGMENERVNCDRLFVDRPPLVEANFVIGVKHSNLAADAAGHEDIGPLVADQERRPGQCVKVFSEKQ